MWFNEVKERTGSNPPVVFLVANKCDVATPAIKDEMIKNAAQKIGGLRYFKCSAKEGTGVSEIFTELAQTMMGNGSIAGQQKENKETTPLTGGNDGEKGGCC